MYKAEVRPVVCDYGVFENEELKLILNSRSNAELIKAILEVDADHERYVVNKGVTLKNINLSRISEDEQIMKIAEENTEFYSAYAVYNKEPTKDNRDNLIEEFYDTVQSKLGLLQMLGITAQETMKYYSRHLKKIENRPRTKEKKED